MVGHILILFKGRPKVFKFSQNHDTSINILYIFGILMQLRFIFFDLKTGLFYGNRKHIN